MEEYFRNKRSTRAWLNRWNDFYHRNVSGIEFTDFLQPQGYKIRSLARNSRKGIASKVVHSPDRPFATNDGLEWWNTDRNKLYSRGKEINVTGRCTYTHRNFTSDFASRSVSSALAEKIDRASLAPRFLPN